jgi:2-polyprenyl-6-methoxyphenol hydroxylase-like FAD-dependent oxidoreductase
VPASTSRSTNASPTWRRSGAGISLWKNALVALDRVGVYELVRAYGVVGSGAGLRTVGWATPRRCGFDRAERSLRRLRHRHSSCGLQRVLLEAVGSSRVRLGTRVHVHQLDRSRSHGHFDNGHVGDGDALIGADGLHSVVRAAIHGDAPPVYRGYTAWRGVVNFDHTRLKIGETWGRGQRFGQMPMSDGQVYWFATANVPPARRRPTASGPNSCGDFAAGTIRSRR